MPNETSALKGSTDEIGRIYFPGNPWPKGHAIEEFVWTARLEKAGLFFDFDLKSANYYAQDSVDGKDELNRKDEEEEKEELELSDDWRSVDAWENYQRCHLSSTYWKSAQGICVSSEKAIRLKSLTATVLKADSLDAKGGFLDVIDEQYGERTPAFDIYLMGHDSAADHTIRFGKNFGSCEYELTWTGKVAHSYVGDMEFRNHFKICIARAKLLKISIGGRIDEQEAKQLLSRFAAEADEFELQRNTEELFFEWKTHSA